MATIINSIKGKINIGGKTFTNIHNITIGDDGIITIDGKSVEEFNGKEQTVFKIEVIGNVESIETENADVEVKGNAGSIVSKNGNVHCGDVTGNVESKNGNVICGSVSGDVNTKNGNIVRKG